MPTPLCLACNSWLAARRPSKAASAHPHACCSFRTVGYPSPSMCYVFDGDFVDRGAWGLEIVLLLAALKLAAPTCVALVRGNHESLYCR